MRSPSRDRIATLRRGSVHDRLGVAREESGRAPDRRCWNRRDARASRAVRTRHDLDSDVVRCVVSGNASAGSTSGETEVKGKYSGLGCWAGLQGGVVTIAHGDRSYLCVRSERWWEWSIAFVRFSQEMMVAVSEGVNLRAAAPVPDYSPPSRLRLSSTFQQASDW